MAKKKPIKRNKKCEIITQLTKKNINLSIKQIENKEKELKELLIKRDSQLIRKEDFVLQEALYNKNDKYYKRIRQTCK